jgi:hypothetical protein
VEQSLRVAVDDGRAEVACALVRLDAATFGLCVACGGLVPDERLEVVPATRFCIRCETTEERSADAAGLPMVDSIVRDALREVDGWADDGPDEDDIVTPTAEEDAVHEASIDQRTQELKAPEGSTR